MADLTGFQFGNNFAGEAAFEDASDNKKKTDKVHIRVQQRNGRKCITTIAGLAEDLDLKRILKAFKKNFKCNGAIVKDKETDTQVVQLSGDQRDNVVDFMVDQEIIASADECVKHGF